MASFYITLLTLTPFQPTRHDENLCHPSHNYGLVWLRILWPATQTLTVFLVCLLWVLHFQRAAIQHFCKLFPLNCCCKEKTSEVNMKGWQCLRWSNNRQQFPYSSHKFSRQQVSATPRLSLRRNWLKICSVCKMFGTETQKRLWREIMEVAEAKVNTHKLLLWPHLLRFVDEFVLFLSFVFAVNDLLTAQFTRAELQTKLHSNLIAIYAVSASHFTLVVEGLRCTNVILYLCEEVVERVEPPAACGLFWI